ncbi:hypothetical protein [Gracilimonas mengyeensis]|uniref:Dolichyl-phosphate-mannose-protein mannosyltransferase n=1 Tax=Gracilimonas mengyeensis TaxID=1302730 RepID=A0A521AIF2_9BACT|nr:hypothetical protein [Gracilimonas mengyeensis]SMO34592.1 hypothetical protein SAMN06265219_101169 [Gracilimonas mengyeensis]
MDYSLQAIFSALRILITFVFLFGYVTPFFFRHAAQQNGIDRIVYSWAGLGGLLTIGVFILVSLHIYDFISILFFLLMLPLLVRFFKRKWEGNSVVDIFTMEENRLVAKQVKLIEKVKYLTWGDAKKKLKKKIKPNSQQDAFTLAAVLIAVSGAVLRIIPSIQNSSPFSRLWYFELDAVKQLSLQQYFDGYPAPRGMHSIIHFFSTITQVSPELILHILGGLISFFLTIIIFWVIRDITRNKHLSAAVFGAMLYAIFPTMFLPVSLELESELSSLSLALCFAIPTAIFYLRNIRSGDKTPWFYIAMGIIATGLTDIFVLLMVLMPFLIFGIFSLPKRRFTQQAGKLFVYLTSLYLLVLSPYVIYCLINGIKVDAFFQDQLFNTQVFSFAPNLLIPIEELSLRYLVAGVFLLVAYLIRHFIQDKKRLGEEIIFLIVFVMVSFVYTPFFDFQYVWIDPDQLNSFYGLLIAIVAGISLHSLLMLIEWISDAFHKVKRYAGSVLTAGFAIWFFVLQDGVEVSRMLPKTQPNGFFDAYYSIINERVPYTYATVGPDLDNGLARNRHYFMNYDFFLDNYGAIDSLYQQYLTVPDNQRNPEEEIPPASIFLFVEKPPYGSIQQGILYDAQGVMRDMEQWLSSYRELEGRKVEVYHETDNAIVYEIINREGESTITGVLRNIYPEGEGRAEQLLK